VQTLKSAIVSNFGLTPTYGDLCAPCQAGDTIGALVRLAFHDAAGGPGTPSNLPGPNGCIDFTASANNGLQKIVSNLTALYHNLFNPRGQPAITPWVSNADFWVLAANTAIQYATSPDPAQPSPLPSPPAGAPPNPPPLPNINGIWPLVLPLVFGRTDDTSCTSDAAYLPSAGNSWSQSDSTAATGGGFGRFGMTAQEIVAIFGAHAVGRAQYANSGFDGGWTSTQSSFANTYYGALVNLPWGVNASNTEEWRNAPPPPPPGAPAPHGTLMLQSDVELAITPSGSCSKFKNLAPAKGSVCPSNTAAGEYVLAYASNIQWWWGNFTTAWPKLTQFHYNVTAGNPPTLVRA